MSYTNVGSGLAYKYWTRLEVLTGTNVPAYYDRESITAVICFIEGALLSRESCGRRRREKEKQTEK